MPRRPVFHKIKDILNQMGKTRKWDGKMKQYSLFSNWPNIVGTNISKHANPTLWQGEVLKVEVETSSWLQELRMREMEIVEKIRDYYPELKITGIHWKLK